MKNSMVSFKKLVLHIIFYVLMLTNKTVLLNANTVTSLKLVLPCLLVDECIFEACLLVVEVGLALLVVFALVALGCWYLTMFVRTFCVSFQQDPGTDGIDGHNQWNHHFLTEIC
jgi:hypothetical protein